MSFDDRLKKLAIKQKASEQERVMVVKSTEQRRKQRLDALNQARIERENRIKQSKAYKKVIQDYSKNCELRDAIEAYWQEFRVKTYYYYGLFGKKEKKLKNQSFKLSSETAFSGTFISHQDDPNDYKIEFKPQYSDSLGELDFVITIGTLFPDHPDRTDDERFWTRFEIMILVAKSGQHKFELTIYEESEIDPEGLSYGEKEIRNSYQTLDEVLTLIATRILNRKPFSSTKTTVKQYKYNFVMK